MLITKKWSELKPVAFGKNILVKSCHLNFSFKISNDKTKSVNGTITERMHMINVDDELIRLIRIPMLTFKANTNDELHVDFEIL